MHLRSWCFSKDFIVYVHNVEILFHSPSPCVSTSTNWRPAPEPSDCMFAPGAQSAGIQHRPAHIKKARILTLLGLSAAAPDRELSLRCLRLTATQDLSLSPNRTQHSPGDHILKKSANRCPADTRHPTSRYRRNTPEGQTRGTDLDALCSNAPPRC